MMLRVALTTLSLLIMTGCSDPKFEEKVVFEALDAWYLRLDSKGPPFTPVESTLFLTWQSSGFMDGGGPLALVEAHPDQCLEVAESFERIGFERVGESIRELLAAWNEIDGDSSRIDPALATEAEKIWFEDHSGRYLKAIFAYIQKNGGIPIH
jgi:hypothetical protein